MSDPTPPIQAQPDAVGDVVAEQAARSAKKTITRERRAAFFDAAREVAPFMAVASRGGGIFVLATGTSARDRAMFVSRRHAGTARVARVVEVLAAMGRPEPLRGRTLVDAGAGEGFVTMAALLGQGAARVLALDPAPGGIGFLRANIALNDLEDRVHVVHAAPGDEDGVIGLRLVKGKAVAYRLVPLEGNAVGIKKQRVIEVPRRRVAAVTEESGISASEIGLLWVDLPGHEDEVLRGAGELAGTVPTVVRFAPRRLTDGRLATFVARVDALYGCVVDLRSVAAGQPEASTLAEIVGDGSSGQDEFDVLMVPAP
jgi:FkbM family methyltransferase